jgi:endoglycosylceramidase
MGGTSLLVGITLLLFALFSHSVTGVLKVDTNTNRLVDSSGRQRLFHGVNAVYKVPPWYPITDHFDFRFSLADEDIAQLKAWGFNAVRLGVMWPGGEPVRGKYNDTYLNIMKSIINRLGAAGIYSIVDIHQDLYHRRFCGEGAPDWAVNVGSFPLPFPIPALGTTAYPKDKDGNPPLDMCLNYTFAVYYWAEQTCAAFQSLYDNTTGIQTAFANYWAHLAQLFKGNEYVLGYELINEPWPGDIYFQPDLLLPGVADRLNLQPMYNILNNAIRQYDNDHIIFFERSLVDLFPAGFTAGPGGPAYNDRQVLSYHIYCGPGYSDGTPRYVILCDAENTYMYSNNVNQYKSLGCGGFLTEFGAMGNETNAISSISYLTSLADEHFQSWTYWQYKYFNDITTAGPGESFYGADGNLETGKVKALSRTYARAIAGQALSMIFDDSTGRFSLAYTLNTTISLPTEIYLNEALYYPKGYTVLLSPPNVATWTSPEKNIINVKPLGSASNGASLFVAISPK